MKAFIFPGQGSQFSGMGYDLYKSSQKAKKLFELGNLILNFNIAKIMFEGSEDDLKQTNVTQPAIFIHSVIMSKCLNQIPDMVAGHSLGEFSALVCAKTISFEDGLQLVLERANAMHLACEKSNSTMAAIIGTEAKLIEKICADEKGVVVPANYNSPQQIVISGERTQIEKVCGKLKNAGAKKTVILPVGGAFHSPIMKPAKEKLENAINNIKFKKPICPIYQNVSAKPVSNPELLKNNLVEQLTAPVKWFQTIQTMIQDGATEFTELGPGNVLTGLNRRIDRSINSVKANL
tara:strand:+ start:19449 stop:20324 length:876 start_codon:yes stop_codon:yes gene_type:complete